jgi:alpha-tubulin suppressor-like RCC1 family protein
VTSVAEFDAGGYHAAAIQSDGTIVCWGNNSLDQCVVPPTGGSLHGLDCGGYHTVALRSDNTVFAFGDNQQGQSTVPADVGVVRAVRAGREHCVALREDGSLRCWGSNTQFQCAQPNGLLASGERIRAVHAGGDRTVVELSSTAADLNGDGAVSAADLSLLLLAWGPCGSGRCDADLDGDGAVGAADLALLLEAWE